MPARGRSAAAAQSVGADAVFAWLESKGTTKDRDGMLRFGIPNDHAFGVPMGTLKAYSKTLGSSHALAGELCSTGWYEARTLAAFIEEPAEVSEHQMDVWAHDNATLNRAAIAVAKKLAASKDNDRAWIGKTALRELTSAKVQARFER